MAAERGTGGCSRIETLLDDASHPRVAAHAARCPACAERLAEARALRSLAAELSALGASDAPRAPDALPPGRKPSLSGLDVVRFLARGGCAEVWLARDPAGEVALKVVASEPTPHELEGLRLYKRVGADPSLGLLPVLHIARCAASGRLCYTMPLADPLHGRTLDLDEYEPATLHAVVERHGPLVPTAAVVLARDVLGSLAALHARGLVHRDVKPANLLRYHGRWCLGDTGLLVRAGKAEAGLRVGTPGFRAADGRDDAPAADLHAFGKTLYVALTGDVARFPAPTAAQLATGPRERRLVRRLFAAAARACDPRPGERFASAAAMLRAVEGGRPRVLIPILAAAALLVVAVVALRAWRGGPRAAVAGGPAAVELEPELVAPGEERSVSLFARPERLRAGSSLVVRCTGPRGHFGLVLATYLDGRRLVQAVAPLPADGDGERIVFAAAPGDPDPLGFLLRDPAPLLGVVFSTPRPWDRAEVEGAVGAALDEAGWPRTGAARPALAAALAFQGTRYRVLASARDVPELSAGASVPPTGPERLLRALAERFPACDGFLVEVHP